MRNKPLITVIVPIYNGEKYIEECVRSIIGQDYKNIEILLVDDGSQDNSGKIVDELGKKDKRIKVFHQKNNGVCVARNTALDKAKGEYVCLIDQDDYISCDYITYLYGLIEEYNAEISLTPCAARFTSERFQEGKKSELEKKVDVWSGEKTAEEMLYYNIVISPWNKMFSRSLIEQYVIRFNPVLFGGEGFSFSIDCLQRAGKVAVGYEEKYYYRVDNPDSGMTKFSMKVIESSIKAQNLIKQNLVKKTDRLLRACQYSKWHTYCDCFNTMVGCNVFKDFPEIYNKIKKVCRIDSLCVLRAHIKKKEKLKGILYFINPYVAARIINHFRIRKFTQGV